MKLGIGIAYHDGNMKVKTALSMLVGLIQHLFATGDEIYFCAAQGPYTHWNREESLEDAYREKCDKLLFIDTDLVFPREAIGSLLSLDKDIVGGSYNYKELPLRSCVKASLDGNVYKDFEDGKMPTEPFRCVAVPTGFMLINLHRLREVPPPYFECVRPMGEDVFICRKALAYGLEIWCDPRFKVGHIGEYIY